MDRSEKPSPLIRIPVFRFAPTDKKDFIVAFFNAAMMLMVGICGLKFVQMILTKKSITEIIFVGVLTAAAFIFNLMFAGASVYGLENQMRAPNITNIIRVMSVLYFIGVCIAYWIVIWKLSERDYERTRYFQYIAILAVSYIAARLYAHIPRRQDIWILGVLILVMNLVHVTYMIFQYVAYEELEAITHIALATEGSNTLTYFFQNLFILFGMACAAIYTLVGSWKV